MQLDAEMQRGSHATCNVRTEERETMVETKAETEVSGEEPVKVATAWELG